jgi:hypothetical protein
MNQPTGMEEILEHEATIRRLLPNLKNNRSLKLSAEQVMAGKPLAGTRFDALCYVASELKKAVGE